MSKIFNRLVRWITARVQGNELSQTLSGGAGDAFPIAPDMPALCRQAAAEGAVLLKNSGVLPIAPGERTAVFGRCASDWFYVGYGSGGDVVKPYAVNLIDGLKNCGVCLDESLQKQYADWRAKPQNEADEGWWGHWPRCFPEMDVSVQTVRDAAERCDLAIVVIGRAAGEDRENTLRRGSYYLTRAEERLLARVTDAFSRVAVVLDIGSIMDLAWLERDRIGAALLVWQGGMESGNAAADVLSGRVNPCGKLPAVIARSYADYPSARSFGKRVKNAYVEDIYVGYRYFETFLRDRVLYPFGYGLSYTSFSMTCERALAEDGTIYVDARVTNTGGCAGREVVQLYASVPQGKLGKPERVLAAFAKTHLLAPGESELIALTCTMDSLASYDDAGATGHPSSYVLEAGDYVFCLGDNVRSAVKVFETELPELSVVRRTERIMPVQPRNGFLRMTNQNGLAFAPVPTAPPQTGERIRAALPDAVPFTGDRGVRLTDVADGRATMDAFLAQLTPDELEAVSRGEGRMDSRFGISGNAGMFAGVTESLRQKGVPPVITTDGPAGIRLKVACSLLPCGTCLAASWDTALIERLYFAVGDEMLARRTDVLLGPGMNIQRSPLCGRNFEYFSEDPLLTGRIAAAVVAGVQHDGLSACPKHFACNNQETNRNRTDAVVSERALREIYLRGFERCIAESGPHNMMTSYNKINGVWSHYNYDLVETLLRGEWGYAGNVMTDWWMRYAASPEFPDIRGNGYRVRARVDVLMPGGRNFADRSGASDGTLLESFGKTDGITLGEMQRTARDVLTMAMRSSAMRRTVQERTL